MKKCFLPILVIILFPGCIAVTNHTNSAKQRDPTETQSNEVEEGVIYRILIEEMYVKDGIKLIVLRDHTLVDDVDEAELAKTFQRIIKQMPALSQATITDFQSINKQTHPLNDSFKLKVAYKLISESETKEIFEGGKEWSEFYDKYPHSQGIMELSKAGFNREVSQALVYVGNQGSWKGGAGFYVLLDKENNTWIIKDKYTAWVS